MGYVLRAMAITAAAFVLSACNIEISLLGDGRVQADIAEVSECNEGNYCLSVGYNQRVELIAEASDGYEFAGWSGACSGTGPCILHSTSNQRVAAIFKSRDAFVPLMNYSKASFLSGPWPSDLKRKVNGQLDLTGFPFDRGAFYSSIQSMAGKQNGYARNGSLYIPMATDAEVSPENAKMNFAPRAEQLIQFVNLEPESDQYLQQVPVQVRLHHDQLLARDSLLQVAPADGYGLEPDTRYGVVLFAATESYLFNLPVIQGEAMQRIIASGGTGLLAEHWQTVREYVLRETPFEADSVAAFALFTTQADNGKSERVKSFLQRQRFQSQLESIRYLGLQGLSCQDSEAMASRSELHEFVVTLPNLIQGKPPFIVSGGRLNLNENGELEDTGLGIEATFWLAVPCDANPPESGYPLEIFALGTAITLQDFQSAGLIDTQNQGVLKVYLAAPYTSDRVYNGGLANIDYLEPLLGLTSDELFPALGDFNPLNLNAVEPQYWQYAADMVVTLEIVKRFQDYLGQGNLAETGLVPERLSVDYDNMTFAGYSLGALAAIHAFQLCDGIKNLMLIAMPRINIGHFNNILDYLHDSFLGDRGMSALQALLGFDYPTPLSDPQLNAMQVAIDPLDPANFLNSLGQSNLLLVLSDFYNPLHGQASSYNFARAVDQRYGLQPVVEYRGNSSFPFDQFVDTASVLYGEELVGLPMRVLAEEQNAGELINTFTRQMKAGTLPTSVGYYGY